MARFALGCGAALLPRRLLNLVALPAPPGELHLFADPWRWTAVRIGLRLLIVGFSSSNCPVHQGALFDRRWSPGGLLSGFFAVFG